MSREWPIIGPLKAHDWVLDNEFISHLIETAFLSKEFLRPTQDAVCALVDEISSITAGGLGRVRVCDQHSQ